MCMVPVTIGVLENDDICWWSPPIWEPMAKHSANARGFAKWWYDQRENVGM
ncbi:hypothetical protein SAMN06265222_1011166 [Neorhodopirellula lusitana]|uniref:Uncharacterized protein n=1 Tax=Neorhodopirellula lusitana TaxID=445327 RepID=A0ABY1PST9_9BACT|nr:hypothetical protein SAMN06265222_1011166 [Neorhodopirellula lusitana]